MSALTKCVSAYKTKHEDDKHTHTRTNLDVLPKVRRVRGLQNNVYVDVHTPTHAITTLTPAMWCVRGFQTKVSAWNHNHSQVRQVRPRVFFSETCAWNMRLRNQIQTCVCKKHTYADLNNVCAVIVMFACVWNQRMGVNNLACEENYYDVAHFPTETSVQNTRSRNNKQVDVGKPHTHVRKSFADVFLCTLTWKWNKHVRVLNYAIVWKTNEYVHWIRECAWIDNHVVGLSLSIVIKTLTWGIVSVVTFWNVWHAENSSCRHFGGTARLIRLGRSCFAMASPQVRVITPRVGCHVKH
jgi:hypothetical protein